MHSIATELAKNEFIETLRLARNRIGNRRMGALGKVIGAHPAMRTLDLSGNLVSFAGACHVAEGVRDSTSLQRLSLAHNKLRADGLYRLAHVAIGHPSMVTLDLRGVPLRKADRRKIEARTNYTRLAFLIDKVGPPMPAGPLPLMALAHRTLPSHVSSGAFPCYPTILPSALPIGQGPELTPSKPAGSLAGSRVGSRAASRRPSDAERLAAAAAAAAFAGPGALDAADVMAAAAAAAEARGAEDDGGEASPRPLETGGAPAAEAAKEALPTPPPAAPTRPEAQEAVGDEDGEDDVDDDGSFDVSDKRWIRGFAKLGLY